jgi:hypothetical protein
LFHVNSGSFQVLKSLLKGELDETDLNIFTRVRLAGYNANSFLNTGGLDLALTFRANEADLSNSLKPGSLVCLLPGGIFHQVEGKFLGD